MLVFLLQPFVYNHGQGTPTTIVTLVAPKSEHQWMQELRGSSCAEAETASSPGGWGEHREPSGLPRLDQTTCPNSKSSTPTLRVNEPQNTEWYSSTPCSYDHMKWITLKTLSSMRRHLSLSPLGWHLSLPEYGAVHSALCAHPIPLGS